MEHNFVANKPPRTIPGEPGPIVIENRKAYDEQTKTFLYLQRTTQYKKQTGGECKQGSWVNIGKYAYDLEDGTEIEWDKRS